MNIYKHFSNERGEITISRSKTAKRYDVVAVFGGKTYTEKAVTKRRAETIYFHYWYKFNEKR